MGNQDDETKSVEGVQGSARVAVKIARIATDLIDNEFTVRDDNKLAGKKETIVDSATRIATGAAYKISNSQDKLGNISAIPGCSIM